MVFYPATFDIDDLFYEHKEDVRTTEEQPDSDREDDGRWQHPVHYVYDAAAERTHEWLMNGVH